MDRRRGPYQEGTILRFKKEVTVILLRDDNLSEHTVAPGIECIVHSIDPPKVDIVGDNALKVLRVELEPNVSWTEYFEIIKYKHLRVIK